MFPAFHPEFTMRQALLTIALAVTVIVTAEAKPNPLNSIKPLQHMTHNDDGDDVLEAYCTAWATISHDKHVWVSAGHCIEFKGETNVPDPDAKYWIDGKPARLVAAILREDPPADISVFESDAKADPLVLAYGSPSPLDPIWTGGYPYGEKRLHVASGVFSNERDDDGFSVYAVPVAGGISGAPVMTPNGMVIGVMRRSECPRHVGWCPVSAGTPTANLRAFLLGEN